METTSVRNCLALAKVLRTPFLENGGLLERGFAGSYKGRLFQSPPPIKGSFVDSLRTLW